MILRCSAMRTQIALPPEQHAEVKLKAADLGISMAEYIRRLIDQDLNRPRPRGGVATITGIFSAEGSSIRAEGKNMAVVEAVDALWRDKEARRR